MTVEPLRGDGSAGRTPAGVQPSRQYRCDVHHRFFGLVGGVLVRYAHRTFGPVVFPGDVDAVATPGLVGVLLVRANPARGVCCGWLRSGVVVGYTRVRATARVGLCG